jgi:hypothetical protein
MEEGTGRDAMGAERKKAWVEVERTDACSGMRAMRADGGGDGGTASRRGPRGGGCGGKEADARWTPARCDG